MLSRSPSSPAAVGLPGGGVWHSKSLTQLKGTGSAMSSRLQSEGEWSASPTLKAGLFERPLRAGSGCKNLGGIAREGSSTGLRLGSALSAASLLLNTADKHERPQRRASSDLNADVPVLPRARTPLQNHLGRNGEVKLLVVVDTEFDIACWVSLEHGDADGPELPLIVPSGKPCSANFVAKDGADIEGNLVLEGFGDSIPFCVCAPASGTVAFAGPASTNFVGERGQFSATVTASDPARRETTRDGEPLTLPVGAKGSPGVTAELSISRQNPARLLVTLRRATEAEACSSSCT